MSYRYRLAYIPAHRIDQVKNATPDDLKKWVLKYNKKGWDPEGECFDIFSFLGQTEIFDLGNCEFSDKIIDQTEPLFLIQETRDLVNNIRIITKDDLLMIIEEIRSQIYSYFKSLQNSSYEELKARVDDKVNEWGNITDIIGMHPSSEKRKQTIDMLHRPYNIYREKESLVNSSLWEYQIFELVRIYRSFPYKKNTLLFYGW